MGAEPWSYFVPFEDDVRTAFEGLQERELAAGRYEKGQSRPGQPNDPAATIDDARRQAGATGTRSILDLGELSDIPHEQFAMPPRFGVMAPLGPDELIGLYGTERPSHEQVVKNTDFYEWIDRGLGIYIVVYDGDRPSELYFAGYSFD
jgi:hypothetical protein